MEINKASTDKSVGVVIATYNGEKYIVEQLESVINQSIKPDFIVVTDGGSNDNTVSICERLLKNAGIVYKMLTSNSQLSVKNNFEKGILHCDTDIIFCSDQDDFWLPNKIEKFLAVFEQYEADMVFSNAYITDGSLSKTGKKLWNTVGFFPDADIKVFDKNDLNFLHELNRHNVVTGMCMAFRGEFRERLLPFSDNAIHDVWIAYKMNQLGRIVALNSCEVLYRQHENNVIGTRISLRSSFSHKNGYYDRLVKRLHLIEDLSNDYNDNQFKNIYESYIKHLSSRVDFIEKKISYFSLISMISNYIQFEYKWTQIVIKDIFTRWYLRK